MTIADDVTLPEEPAQVSVNVKLPPEDSLICICPPAVDTLPLQPSAPLPPLAVQVLTF